MKNTITNQMFEQLTHDEKILLSVLGDVWNRFLEFENRSKDDTNDFRKAIHDCQRIVGMRVARRTNPDLLRMPK